MINNKGKTVLSLLCVMFLMGSSGVVLTKEQDKHYNCTRKQGSSSCVSKRVKTKISSDRAGRFYDAVMGEGGTVRVLEAIRQEIALFRKDCSCSCPAGVGK